MNEVVRLAHTKEFHDKETDYIVWKNREALAKMVSPKKPSFEAGGQTQDSDAPAAVDFSSGRVTPEQAQRAVYEPRASQFEIKQGR